jgi:hypothetical protein
MANEEFAKKHRELAEKSEENEYLIGLTPESENIR